jgi:hypothetical protein
MTTTPARSYSDPVRQATVDGGYSGTISVTVAAGNPGVPPMVFVDSDLVTCGLVLTAEAAHTLGTELLNSAAEVLPPTPSVIRAFGTVFGVSRPLSTPALRRT